MVSSITLKKSTFFVTLAAVGVTSAVLAFFVLRRESKERPEDQRNLAKPSLTVDKREPIPPPQEKANYDQLTGKEWVEFADRDVVSALKAAVENSGGKIESLGDPVFLVLKKVTLEDAPGVIDYLNTLSEKFKPNQLAHALSATAMKQNSLRDRIKLASLFKDESTFEPFMRGILNSTILEVEGIPEMTSLAKQARFPELAEQLYSEKIVASSNPESLPGILDGISEAFSGNPAILQSAFTQIKGAQTEVIGRWVMSQSGFDPETHGRVAETAFTKWALTDPNAAAAFLNNAPEAPLTDAAIAGLVRVLNNRDPAAAEAWSSKIGSSFWRERAETLKAVHGN